MRVKNTYHAIKRETALAKVNKAVAVLGKMGVGFNLSDAKNGVPSDGLIGLPRNLSKRETRKITAAAKTMTNNSASFFRRGNRKQFTSRDAINTAHYAPMSMSNYRKVQEDSFAQIKQSIHLRAPVQFLKNMIFDARLQAVPNRRALGITSEESQDWSAMTESLWRSEKNSKSWDETRQNDYAQIADIAFYLYKAVGEFFAVRRAYFDDDTRLTNLSIQLFHPFQIQSPIFTNWCNISYRNTKTNNTVIVNSAVYLSDLRNGHYIEAGIEYNKQHQEVAIFIAPVSFGDPWVKIPCKTASGFQQVLHGFIQKQPGEKRGIPESALSWHEYCNIRDLTIFELNSARLNSTIAGSVTADSNAQPNGKTPMNDLGDKQPGWSEESPAGDGLAEYEAPSYDVREVNGGGFIVQNFTPGYKFAELDTKRPNQNIPLFIEKLLEFAYPADYGLSVTLVNQRLEGSYNASKGKIDLSWKLGVEYALKQFSSDFHRPNYDAWLAGKVASGEVAAPGWENFRLRNAWSGVNIITPPKPSMNPKQEADGALLRISGGLSNRELESQNLTGTSFEENSDRLEMENENLADANASIEPVEIGPDDGMEENENA